ERRYVGPTGTAALGALEAWPRYPHTCLKRCARFSARHASESSLRPHVNCAIRRGFTSGRRRRLTSSSAPRRLSFRVSLLFSRTFSKTPSHLLRRSLKRKFRRGSPSSLSGAHAQFRGGASATVGPGTFEPGASTGALQRRTAASILSTSP